MPSRDRAQHWPFFGTGLVQSIVTARLQLRAANSLAVFFQHELLPLYKKGGAPHVNNVMLGRRGRSRSNVWTYPGASSLGSDARRGLRDHPIVKPVAMLEDAILDVTNRGDLVLHPFLGSGSTLMAAEKTGRVCYGVELDPLYVDVIITRFHEMTGEWAVLEQTGVPFSELLKRRRDTAAEPLGM